MALSSIAENYGRLAYGYSLDTLTAENALMLSRGGGHSWLLPPTASTTWRSTFVNVDAVAPSPIGSNSSLTADSP
jgi:hypothetical protein